MNRSTMPRLMIVEDNPRARCALKALISQQSEIIVTAEALNGQDAIRKIKSHVPDIVLMDMQMPVMGGLEATKIIKSKWPQIKIIILTMYPDRQAEVLSAGADAFLVKGCCEEEIVSIIRSLTNEFMLPGESSFKKAPPRFA